MKGINKVLSGELDSTVYDGCPDDIISKLQRMDSNMEYEIDSNGWQHDFWIDIVFFCKKYQLSGTWFFSTKIEFTAQ